MTHLPPIERLTKMNIDGAALASTLIGTTRNGADRFSPLMAIISVRAANAILSVSSISIGTNATNYDDIVPISALTGLSAANKMLKLDILTALTSIAPNTDVYLKVTTIAVATECKLDITLLGFYQ